MKIRNILVFIVTLICTDQVVKYMVSIKMTPSESLNIIPNVLDFTYYTNPGVAFSMMQGAGFIIILVSVLLFFVLVYELYKNYKDKWTALSFCLLIGGLVGNLIDRIMFGYVRDFIDFKFSFSFPVFNIGDIAIVLGACMLILNILRGGNYAKNVNR